jgi:hypothetical protein
VRLIREYGGWVNLVEPGSIEGGGAGVRYAWDGRMLH